MYRTMLLIRRFEEKATEFFLNGQIRGSFHPCIGQEGTAVGAVAALRRDDYMTCTYRGHGHAIAKGLDPKEAMAELLGKRTGLQQGEGRLDALHRSVGRSAGRKRRSSARASPSRSARRSPRRWITPTGWR